MTLDEAIEKLTIMANTGGITIYPDDVRAIKLAIEALKHYREVRPVEVSKYYPLLPGETYK